MPGHLTGRHKKAPTQSGRFVRELVGGEILAHPLLARESVPILSRL